MKRARRARRRNPAEAPYWLGFGLAACAVVGVLYVAKNLAGAASEKMRALSST